MDKGELSMMDEADCESYLAEVSKARLERLVWPEQSWRARCKCFALFDKDYRPMHISPRVAKVSRRVLYRYYSEWSILNVRARFMRLRAARLKAEREAEYQAELLSSFQQPRPHPKAAPLKDKPIKSSSMPVDDKPMNEATKQAAAYFDQVGDMMRGH